MMALKIGGIRMRTRREVLFVFPLCLLLFLAVSCGKKTPPEEFTVKIINVQNELIPSAWIQCASHYRAAHPGLILHTSTEIVSADASSAELQAQLEGSDVVIFPSLLHKTLHALPHAFYPVSVTDSVLPPIVNTAYAAASPNAYWAAPLLLDPVLMIVKSQAAKGIGKIPSNWIDFTNMDIFWDPPRPHLVFLTGTPTSLADGVAAQQLARGFEKYALQNIPPDPQFTREEEIEVLQRSLQNLNAYFSLDMDSKIIELPQVEDLSAFLRSSAYMTFARRSARLALAEEEQIQLMEILTPANDREAIPCYLISAAIPLNAANPSRAEEYIAYLLDHARELADAQHYLPCWTLIGTEDGIGEFSPHVLYTPRIQSINLGQKAVIDAMNGAMAIEEMNGIWKEGFYIPGAGV
ncbi:MAG: hypothetical protein C4527_28520 [Candidatus Omnitrophota bacterium]|jgi:hypothetical protein|nr:MAG: hypothetical protein C4527_28520 [Candidatus Omnitrophota bacterium]